MGEPFRRSSPERVKAALEAAAEYGLFFAWGDPAADPLGWHAVGSLYAAGPGPLDAIIEEVRQALGGCESRVAASVFFQGYAARLLSPPLACIAMRNCLPDLPAGGLCWRQDAAMPALALSAGEGLEGPADLLICELVRASFDQHLLPLGAAVLSRVKVAGAVLTDNAASALVAGVGLLREQFGANWQALAAGAVRHRYLDGCGSFPEPGLFIRRSCCLVYQVPSHGLCGDCPIGRPHRGGKDS